MCRQRAAGCRRAALVAAVVAGMAAAQGTPAASQRAILASDYGFTTIPRVREYTPGVGGTVALMGSVAISASDPVLHPHARVLAQELMNYAGIAATVVSDAEPAPSSSSPATISLILNHTMQDADNAYYPYELTVSADTGTITITGGSVVAVAHGTATLLHQLRPAAEMRPEHPSAAKALVNASSVRDWSTVQWTGFMYDLARDPVDISYVKSMVELCRFYKMRFLHFFATAEEGWRLPIAPDAAVEVPAVFKGLVYWGLFDSWWHSECLDNANLRLNLTHTGNGTWSITASHATKDNPTPTPVDFATVDADFSIFYFGQQVGRCPCCNCKATDIPNITFTKTPTQILVTTTVNGKPADLWWVTWIKPKMPPVKQALSPIAAAAASGPGRWCNESGAWAELNAYAEARGVTLVPEIEVIGHNSLPAEIFGDPNPALTSTNLASDAAVEGVLLLLDSVIATFPTSPIIHIGGDEVSTAGVMQTQGVAEYCAKHNLSVCDLGHITDLFMTTLNARVHKAGKRMMGYENHNTNGTLAAADLSVITQPWHINGGAGAGDMHKTDLHGSTLSYSKLGLDTVQTAWKPRFSTRVHGVFEHSVGGTVYTHPGAPGQDSNGLPIPINKRLLGAEMVLWETQRGPEDKVGFMRLKAPPVAENTYAYGADTTSWYLSWADTFGFMDEQFSVINTGFRLEHSGVTRDLGDLLRTNTETSMDPDLAFAEKLTLTLTVNRPGTVVRYTNATFELDNSSTTPKILSGDGKYPTNISSVMPPILSFTHLSPELGNHGYIAIRAQAFDAKSGERVGDPVVRKYWCEPFRLAVAGTLRIADLSGLATPGVKFGPHVHELALFTEGYATVAVMEASDACAVHYMVGGAVTSTSPALPKGSQLAIRSSTDIITIACFASSGMRIGRVWAAHFNSNLDKGIFGGTGALKPDNAVVLEPAPKVQRWELPLFDRPGNFTTPLSALLAHAGVPGIAVNTSVKLTVVVVGGGGASGSGRAGGAGGVATEVYYDVLTCYNLTIEVGGPGQQSSVAFDDGPNGYRSLGPGRDSYQARGAADTAGYPIRITQDPIFPTVAGPGTDGGAQGVITKGNPTFSNSGGAGWHGSESGKGTGAGAGGNAAGKQGAAGCVWILAELLQ